MFSLILKDIHALIATIRQCLQHTQFKSLFDLRLLWDRKSKVLLPWAPAVHWASPNSLWPVTRTEHPTNSGVSCLELYLQGKRWVTRTDKIRQRALCKSHLPGPSICSRTMSFCSQANWSSYFMIKIQLDTYNHYFQHSPANTFPTNNSHLSYSA